MSLPPVSAELTSQETRTTLRRKNLNAIKKQGSNWLLAISLALTGGGLIDVFAEESRFTSLEAIGLIFLGGTALVASLRVLYYMEDEESDNVA